MFAPDIFTTARKRKPSRCLPSNDWILKTYKGGVEEGILGGLTNTKETLKTFSERHMETYYRRRFQSCIYAHISVCKYVCMYTVHNLNGITLL